MITTLVWSERLLGIAILFQSIETLRLKNIWTEDGIWRWSTVRNDFDVLPPILLKTLDLLLAQKSFEILLKLRVAISIMVWIVHPALFIAFLFLSTWLIAIRFRGIFNGGSDSMTALVALSLTFAQAFHEHPLVLKACFAFIAVHVTASYFLAGLSKIKNPEWRLGLALPVFFKTPRYDSPPEPLRALLKNQEMSKRVSWAIMLFECSFPLAWTGPKVCAVYIILALIFHIVNYYVFGLNRFLFAWMSGYPALYFWSQYG